MTSASILILDDSITVRMDLVEAFEAAGFRCLPCATLGEARELVSRESVDLLVLDVLLPDGDGLDFLAEIRADARLADRPVLMLSSEADVKDRIRGLRTGADDYVGKPYDRDYVVARTRQLLPAGPPVGDPETRLVLVIDDSPTYRHAITSVLKNAGYAVAAAASGEEGLRMAASLRPGAILVDSVLPGVDGPTVIRRIRLDVALRDIPCLLLTGDEDTQAELRALDAGSDAFLRKDLDTQLILAKLASILRARNAGSAVATSLMGPKKLLMVDGSTSYREALSAALRPEGYDLMQARSGEEALEMLGMQPADCVLMDLLVPGAGGLETCRRMKADPRIRDIPLIILASTDDSQSMLQALGAGADDCIAKSEDFRIIQARIRSQFRRRQFEDEIRRVREEALRQEIESIEARAARELAAARAALVEELQRKNTELEAFSYSVSHDLKAPLRHIETFGRLLETSLGPGLDPQSQAHLGRIQLSVKRMSDIIDDLLQLSRAGRTELHRSPVNLSTLAHHVLSTLQEREPDRQVHLEIADGLTVDADARLMRVLLENLLGNAWKFTSRTPEARIVFGAAPSEHESCFFVQDNGAGFDMKYLERLFRPFQRLHTAAEFPGTGIGLATVKRIVDRHGGRLCAEACPDRGATFTFSIAHPH